MRYSNYYPASGLFHVSLPLLMGTRMDVLLFGDDRHLLERIWERMETELRRLEKMLNRFDPTGETAIINRDVLFSDVRLSDQLWNILLDCRRYFEATDGCFDITMTDFEKIVFMDELHTIHFDKEGMALDFGGYAKGYALKYMREQLDEAGMKRALVNFGNSSILALGAHPYGDSWPVGIEEPAGGTINPSDDSRPVGLEHTAGGTTFHLRDTSLSVSGNTPSHPSHIINPKTGEFMTGDRMVAIVADDPVDAEALTTAWLASGNEEIPDWMSKFNLKHTYRIK